MSDGPAYLANLQRGRLLRETGRYAEACTFLGRSIEANPEGAEAYLELALAQGEMPGRKAEAMRTMDRAIALEPNSAHFLGFKAYLWARLGLYPEALEFAKSALSLDPNSHIGLLAQTNVFTKLNHWSLAEQSARRMLELDPEDTSAMNLLAQALRFRGKLAECRAVISRILACVPEDSFAQTNAGYEAFKTEDYRRANGHFLEALRSDPSSDYARQGLLQSLRTRVWMYRANMKFMSFMVDFAEHARLFRIVFVFFTLVTLGGCLGLFLLYALMAITLLPLSNFFLMLEPIGWHALTDQERRDALLVSGIIAGGLLILALTGLGELALVIATYCLLFAFFVYLPQWTDAWRVWREKRLLSEEGST